METVDWYYTQRGERQGPVSLDALRELRAGGSLTPSDLVWRTGLDEWAAASTFEAIGFGEPEPAVRPQTSYASQPTNPAQSPFASQPVARPHVPIARVAYAQPHTGPITCTPRAIDLMQQTRPWVRFIGIALVSVGGLSLAFGLLALLVAVVGTKRNNNAEVGVVGLCFTMMGSLYLLPGVYLNRFASRISTLLTMRTEESLELAIQTQKSFWKLCGVCVVLLIVFSFLGFFAAIIA